VRVGYLAFFKDIDSASDKTVVGGGTFEEGEDTEVKQMRLRIPSR